MRTLNSQTHNHICHCFLVTFLGNCVSYVFLAFLYVCANPFIYAIKFDPVKRTCSYFKNAFVFDPVKRVLLDLMPCWNNAQSAAAIGTST